MLHSLRRSLALFFALTALTALAAPPVEFRFKLPDSPTNPYARELWADVTQPDGKTLRLPVFFAGSGLFAVRARASQPGNYTLGPITESTANGAANPNATVVGPAQITVKQTATLPQVMGYRGRPARFLFADATPFTPIGANVAWASEGRTDYHLKAIADFKKEGLNWMRLWMVHWSALNLDWLPADMGASPPPGILDQRISANWDRLIAAAEENGVYLQITLQHHGQVASEVNSNWSDNPWNAANPHGFLKTPTEFFSSPDARAATALKYRYITARWGYSPAVFAWELFNEVHWTDPMRVAGGPEGEALIADWHAAMAKVLRRHDPYHHLVTTSTENLRSAIYAKMDFYQPHLYGSNQIAGARSFDPDPATLDRPAFYGEVGDDHLNVSPAVKASGLTVVPPVWASLMGQGVIPAQPWQGEQLIQRGRLGELGAVARFLNHTQIATRKDLTTFAPAVTSDTRVPLRILGAQRWQKRPAPELAFPLDGSESPAFADIPRIYVGSPGSLAEGYPGSATYRIQVPATIHATAHLVAMGGAGTAIRILVDGQPVAERAWAAGAADAPTPEKPADLAFDIPAGAHTLQVLNPGAPDWFELAHIDLGLQVSALGAIGQRSPTFLAVWLWNKLGVFADGSPEPIKGATLTLPEVPAGAWTLTWWDTFTGQPGAPRTIEHAGGSLALPVPDVPRHTAVTLSRD